MSGKRPSLWRWGRAALIGLAFCALSAAAPAATQDPVLLRLWTADSEPHRIAAIRYLMNGFVASHDGIEVQVRGVEEEDMANAFAAALDGGHPPDLVHAVSDTVVALGALGRLDLDRTTKLVEDIGARRFAGGAKRMLRASDGRYFGIPYHGWMQA